MYLGLVIFVLLWVPVVCMSCLVAGAYIMFCKQNNLNPVRSGLVLHCQEPDFEAVVTNKPDSIPGFYD